MKSSTFEPGLIFSTDVSRLFVRTEKVKRLTKSIQRGQREKNMVDYVQIYSHDKFRDLGTTVCLHTCLKPIQAAETWRVFEHFNDFRFT